MLMCFHQRTCCTFNSKPQLLRSSPVVTSHLLTYYGLSPHQLTVLYISWSNKWHTPGHHIFQTWFFWLWEETGVHGKKKTQWSISMVNVHISDHRQLNTAKYDTHNLISLYLAIKFHIFLTLRLLIQVISGTCGGTFLLTRHKTENTFLICIK